MVPSCRGHDYMGWKSVPVGREGAESFTQLEAVGIQERC